MIRALRWLLSRHFARGGYAGPQLPSDAVRYVMPPTQERDLDPDDPIVRLVRQARAMGDGRIHHYLGDTVTNCPNCMQDSQRTAYAHSLAVSHDYAIPIATYCPNCPPKGDDDE